MKNFWIRQKNRLSSMRRRRRDQDRQFFSAGLADIGMQNMRTLVHMSGVMTALVCLLLVTPVIIPRFRPTPQHWLFAPAMFVFFIAGVALWRHGTKRNGPVNLLCVLFVLTIYGFVIGLDVYAFPLAPCTFMPVALIAIPAVFIFRRRVIYSIQLVVEVFFVASSHFIKATDLAEFDSFGSLVGLLISLVVAEVILQLRTESFCAKNQYRQLSMMDGLTGILNKTSGEMAVRQYLDNCGSTENYALLMMDVDNFKHINDSNGHKIGDDVLIAVANLLSKMFRTSDAVGRFGGDEFLVLMKHVQDDEAVRSKCAKLDEGMRALSARFQMELTLSIGIALAGGAETEYDRLFQLADDALYEAKTGGKARCAMHRLEAETAAAIRSEKRRMLVADDNDMNRVILSAAFGDEFEIIQAATGHEALELIGTYREKLDIVLLDLMMPDIDGYQILRYIKSRKNLSEIPVVVITADNQSEKDVLALGAADMIAKPFDAEIASMRVHNALRRRGTV